MIRGIIFDCFGVLYHGSIGYLRELMPIEKIQEFNDLCSRFDYGYITKLEYLQQVGELIGRTPEQVDAICQQQHTRNEKAVELVRRVRPDYKIAILSNIGRGFIDELFTVAELKELFDVEVLSNEVHLAKPSREIYELTATKLALSPQECIMIDDSPDNVIGAENTGMKAILYQSAEQVERDLKEILDSHA